MIQLFFEGFLRLGIMPRSIEGVAIDVKPEISPLMSMLSSIFITDDSQLEQLHYDKGALIHSSYRSGNGNHTYEYLPLGNKKFRRITTHESLWAKTLDAEISVQGSKIYCQGAQSLFTGSFERTRRMAGQLSYDFELERDQYALGTMLYGAETVANDREQMAYIFNRFFDSLKEGAPFVVVILQDKELFPGVIWEYAMPIKDDERQITPEMLFTSHPYRIGDDEALVLIGRRC
jgi:hypothetical protein